MQALLAFAAALVALRLAGDLVRRHRTRPAPELTAWAGSLGAYAVASATIAWGSAHGWDDRAFRVYYCAGGLLPAALLGAGSLLLVGRRRAGPLALVYVGLAVGVALAVPLHGTISGTAVPAAQAHLAFFPARLLAVLGNVLGTAAAAGVALWTFRRRRLGNALVLAGIAVAAAGSAVFGLGAGGASVFLAAGVVLLYAGFVGPSALPALVGIRRAGATRE